MTSRVKRTCRHQVANLRKVRYPSSGEEERTEQKYATNMEYKHGVGLRLSEASTETRGAVDRSMENLKTALSLGLETNEKNQVAEIIAEMGPQIWWAAINLRNQKGTIIHSFSTAAAVKILKTRYGDVGGQPQWMSHLAEFEGRFWWFPHVIIDRPLHTYDHGIIRSGPRASIDHYYPACAPVHVYHQSPESKQVNTNFMLVIFLNLSESRTDLKRNRAVIQKRLLVISVASRWR